MTKKKSRFKFFVLVFVFGFVFPPFLGAQRITYDPRLFLSGEYNDNLSFSNTDKEEDFILNISPAMELKYASELFDLSSFGLVRFVRHQSDSDFDREDYYLDLSSRYRMTERLNFFGKFNYFQDETLEWRTIDLIQTGSGKAPINESGIVERGIESFLSERKTYNAYGSLSYQLTELSNMGIGYSYQKTDYDLEANEDFEVNDISMTYMRDLAGQRNQIGTRLTYSQRTSDISDTDSYGTGFIWSHTFSETFSLYTDIGLRYTEETFKNVDQKNDNWGVTSDIRLRRLGETNVINIGFSQNVQTASGGGSVNVSRLYWNSRQTLSERFRFGFDGDFYITREDGDSFSDIETVFLSISPLLQYLLTENYSINLAYNYNLNHNRTVESNRDTERNRIWIVFEFGFPNEW